MKSFAIIPDNPGGYEIFEGDFAIITPEATTNLVENPSVETNTTGYTAIAGAIARTTDDQFVGVYGLEITPNVGVLDGVYYDITLSINTSYTFSCDVKGELGLTYKIYFADNAGSQIGPATEFTGRGFWERQHVIYTEATGAARRVYLARVSKGAGDSAVFYTDGWQVEAKGYPTTYTDGDQVGFVAGQNDFGWNGTAHASTSFRTDATRAGGKLVRLFDIGYRVTGVIGLGMPPVSNLAIPSQLGGEVYQNTITQPRTFSLVGTFMAVSRAELHYQRNQFIDLIDFHLTPIPQPLVMRYTPLDECGDARGEPVRIDCTYQSGLGMQVNNNFQERLVVSFTQHKPDISEVRDRGFTIARNQFVAGNYLFKRDKDGNWTNISADEVINAIAESNDKKIYVGGNFTSIGGVAANYIAVYDPPTDTWSALGSGFNSPCNDIAIDQSGNVYACGSFTTAGGGAANYVAFWDGAAWTALGAGLSGTGNALAFGGDGSLYVVGNFANAGGIGVNSIARWDGVVWTAVGSGSGLQSAGPVLGRGNDIIFVPEGGDIAYVGGIFTIADGVSGANNIIKVDVVNETFTQMGDGVESTSFVDKLAGTADGVLYVVGGFDTAGNVNAGGIAKWNGNAWFSVGDRSVGQPVSNIVIDNRGNVIVSSFDFGLNFFTTYDVFDIIKIARWDGSNWNNEPVHIPSSGTVVELAFDSELNLWVSVSITAYTGSTGQGITVPGTKTLVSPLKINSSTIFNFVGQRKMKFIKNSSTQNDILFGYDVSQDETIEIDFPLGGISVLSSKSGNISNIVLPGSARSRSFLRFGENKLEFYQYPNYISSGDTNGTEPPQIREFNLSGVDATNSDNGCLYVELTKPSNWRVDFYEDAAKLSMVAQTGLFSLAASNSLVDVSAVGGSGISGTIIPFAPFLAPDFVVDTDIVVCFSIGDVEASYTGAYSSIDEV